MSKDFSRVLDKDYRICILSLKLFSKRCFTRNVNKHFFHTLLFFFILI
nr:MAG TPA: hypothetical protein [Bacteriophage sp.]